MPDTPALRASVTPELAAHVIGGAAVAFVNPRTGSVVDAKSDAEELADYLELVRHVRDELRQVDAQVSSWIVARMDASLSWTLATSVGKVTADSPQADPVYDLEKLRGILHRLVREGAIAEEAAAACIVQRPAPPAPPPAVDRSAVAKLCKLSPRVAKRVEGAVVRRAGSGERKVSVKP
jgi:hypothetical protein